MLTLSRNQISLRTLAFQSSFKKKRRFWAALKLPRFANPELRELEAIPSRPSHPFFEIRQLFGFCCLDDSCLDDYDLALVFVSRGTWAWGIQ